MNIITTCLRWIWLPLLLVVALAVLLIPRYRFRQFFKRIGFTDFNGRTPRYVKSVKESPYLRKIRFRSRIPLNRWAEIQPDLEQFQHRKICDIHQPRENINLKDVFFTEQELPDFIVWSDTYLLDGAKFTIGEGYKGQVVWDASVLNHGLIAGATGSGKTSIIRCIIYQAIHKKFNVSVLDFKGGVDYSDLEQHYGSIVVSEPEEARQLLLALINEVKYRAAKFREYSVCNINEYNALGGERLIPWLLIIDEAAEILDIKPADKAQKELYNEISQSLRTLARLSRSAGVHILMGFIRPDATVLDGQIKNNLLWRACGYFADPAASRIVLNNDKATELPPEIKGRFIVDGEEVQAYYLPRHPKDGSTA